MYIQNKSWRSHGGGPYTQLQIRQYPKLPFSCGFWPDDVRRRRQLKRSFAPYRPVQSYIVYIPPIFFFLPFSTNSGTYIAFSLSLSLLLAFLSPSFPIPYIGVAVLFTTQRFRSLRFRVSFAVPYSRTATAASFLCCLPSLYSNTTPPRLGKGKKILLRSDVMLQLSRILPNPS